MADAEQWRPEVEEQADATEDALPNNGNEVAVSPKEVANEDVADILAFDDIGGNVDGTTKGSDVTETQVETGESSRNGGEVLEEEIVELEFEKLKPKLATHTMHCPHCDNEITKVTLRRRVLSYRPPQPVAPVVAEPETETEPKSIFGCLSCLSLFTCSDTGRFNPFDIFKKKPEPSIDHASPPSDGEQTTPMLNEKETCFSMFWVIRNQKGKINQTLEDPQQPEPLTFDQVKHLKGSTSIRDRGTSEVPYLDTAIDIVNEPDIIADGQTRGRPWLGYEGVLAEILKSIVYGGLMEVIASLSVVASAAASDATTLSIISLALASLIGGVFVIGHNLWDLRDDCYKDDSSQETNKEATNKYKELLGQVNYFPLHAFFAILSYLVFGLVPPVAYGFSFHETNDKDLTVVVVAIASLLCVSVLAIFKAYINKCTVFDYFKTVVYYVTTAVSVSGVSYVAGNLITRLIEEYGLFEMSPDGGIGMSFLPQATTTSIASF